MPVRLKPFGHSSPIDLSLAGAEAALSAYLDEQDPTARYGRFYYPAAASGVIGSEPTAGGWRATCGFGDPERVSISDLGWAVLLVGQPRPASAASLLSGDGVALTSRERVTLAEASDADLAAAVGDLNALCSLKGIGMAIAAKMLHVKRPSLIPVLDRTSGFGTYFSTTWTLGKAERSDGSRGRTLEALRHLRRLLADPSNQWDRLDGWVGPAGQGPFTRVQLWDMVWWSLRHRPSLAEFADANRP